MISPKGFLEPNANNRPRMTAAQGYHVLKATQAALDLAIDDQEIDKALGALVKQTVTTALSGYPQDRSCFTCDFYTTDNVCLHYHQDIPADHLESGCDQHKDESGTPF